jgi:hypothetical protein
MVARSSFSTSIQNGRHVASADLDQFLTSKIRLDRQLGKNESIEASSNLFLILTGNNITGWRGHSSPEHSLPDSSGPIRSCLQTTHSTQSTRFLLYSKGALSCCGLR